jgi:hypothetical protein
MPHKAFKDGYVSGWRSIRGGAQIPNFPAFSVAVGQTPYQAGVIQGIKDAATHTATTIDDLFDRALQRSWGG